MVPGVMPGCPWVPKSYQAYYLIPQNGHPPTESPKPPVLYKTVNRERVQFVFRCIGPTLASHVVLCSGVSGRLWRAFVLCSGVSSRLWRVTSFCVPVYRADSGESRRFVWRVTSFCVPVDRGTAGRVTSFCVPVYRADSGVRIDRIFTAGPSG